MVAGMAAESGSGRLVPLQGIHEIIDRQPDAEMCIDLLCAYFGADRALDPGPVSPLAVRLGTIGPSIVDDDPPGHLAAPLAFGLGSEHVVGGELVRFYDGKRGSGTRFAFAVADADRDVIHSRSEGGWIDLPSPPVLSRVFSAITSRLIEIAPSMTYVDWGPWELETPLEVEPDEMCRKAPVPLLAVDGWLDPTDRLFSRPTTLYVGSDVVVHTGPQRLFVAGASDEAVRAIGLAEVGDSGQVRVEVRRSDRPFGDGPGDVPPPEVVQSWVDALPATMDLDRLDDVEWSRLFHAYGPADDVPAMLLDVAESDGDVDWNNEESGFYGLFTAVAHQNSAYGSTAFVMPFVGHLLATRRDLRLALLQFLIHATLRADYPELPTFDGDSWADRWTFSAVDRLGPLLLELAMEDDEATASAALEALSQLPGVAAETFDALTETPLSAATAHVAYVVLGITGRATGRRAAELPSPSDEAPPDVLLAWGMARCLLGDAGGVELVQEHLDGASALDRFWDGGRSLALRALATVERALGDEAIERMIDEAGDGRIETIRLLAPLVFPRGAPEAPELMSDLQRGFADRIKRLIDDGSWNYVDAGIGMSTDALERYLEGDFDPTL